MALRIRDWYGFWPALLLVAFLIWHGSRCVENALWEPPLPEDAPKAAKRARTDGSDFTCYYSAGELAVRGEDIYDYRRSSTPTRQYLYPSTFAVFPMALLALLPLVWAAVIYYILNIFMLCVVLVFLKKMLYPANVAVAPPVPLRGRLRQWRSLPNVGLALALLLSVRFIENNLKLGNANIFTLFLLTLALKWLVEKREFFAGAATALAAAYKISPGLFGLYLLWTWRKSAMVGGAVGLLFFLLVLPSAVMGPTLNWEMLKEFYRRVAEPTIKAENKGTLDSDAEGSYVSGISVRGTMLKLLTPVETLRENQARAGNKTINVVNLAPKKARLAADLLALALLGWTVFLTLEKRKSRSSENVAPTQRMGAVCSEKLIADWSLVVTAMLLIAPITRKAHLSLTLLPCAVLIAFLQRGLLARRQKAFAIASLALFGFIGLCSAPGLYEVIFGKKLGNIISGHIHSHGALTLAVICLFFALSSVLWQFRGARKYNL
jgi:hypothetical protein